MATLKGTFDGVSVYMSERSDNCGNPRCIVHFLEFLKPSEDFGGILEDYEIALQRARKAGFRKYTAREFGGGFICQYDYAGGREIAARVIKAREF